MDGVSCRSELRLLAAPARAAGLQVDEGLQRDGNVRRRRGQLPGGPWPLRSVVTLSPHETHAHRSPESPARANPKRSLASCWAGTTRAGDPHAGMGVGGQSVGVALHKANYRRRLPRFGAVRATLVFLAASRTHLSGFVSPHLFLAPHSVTCHVGEKPTHHVLLWFNSARGTAGVKEPRRRSSEFGSSRQSAD